MIGFIGRIFYIFIIGPHHSFPSNLKVAREAARAAARTQSGRGDCRRNAKKRNLLGAALALALARWRANLALALALTRRRAAFSSSNQR